MATLSLLVVGALCAALVSAQPCYFHTNLIDSTAAGFDGSTGFSAFTPPTAVSTGDGWAIGPHDNSVGSAIATWSGLPAYDCYSVTFRYWALDSQDVSAGDHGAVEVNGVEIWSGSRQQHDSCLSDPIFSPYSGAFPNPWDGDKAQHKCFHDVVNHAGTLGALSTTFSLDLQGQVDQAIADESWAVSRVIAAVGTTTPPCPISFNSAWLQTEWEPVLDVADSGFLKYSHGADVLSIVFDNPDKYDFQSATIFSAGETTVNHGDPADDVSASSPQSGAYTHPGACYTRYEVHSSWGDVEANCNRDAVSDTDFIIYTCKLRVVNRETLDPIRGTALNREVISEIPYQIKFPKQVSASVLGLSAFQPPDVLAAIVRQEVIVNVNNLGDLDATIKLYTSIQWPFRLNDGSHAVTLTPADISSSAFVLETDCGDANLGDVANPTVDDSAACGQTWRLELDVANGAAGPPCELDGDYAVLFTAECQPSFDGLTDCPLVQDDQGVIQNEFPVNFRIDSEWFCPQVVHTVDLSASLHVWKDQAHSIAATNFIIGQTAYFEARTASTDVTIVKTVANRITIKPLGAGADTLVYSLQEPGAAECQAADLGDTGAVNGLAVQDGPCESTVPATEAWFNFLIDGTSVPGIPTDGSRDFEVGVVLDVTFKNAGALLEQTVTLLQTVSSTESEQRAKTQFGVGGEDDTTAGAAMASTAAVAVAGGVAGLLL